MKISVHGGSVISKTTSGEKESFNTVQDAPTYAENDETELYDWLM
jgi:hypothetical protein